MPDRKFQTTGTSVPAMLGRQTLVNRMMGALAKPTPDHLQVVGPRYAGKTVILHELSKRFLAPGSPYTAVLHWDLGHQTPASDELFMAAFSAELSEALQHRHPEYSQHLRHVKGNPYQDIAEVLDLLKDENGKVLAILDGFDKPLTNGKLTRNLWDQLRELALKPSLRLVTASRRTLRDLIRQPDAQTSDFWNIFDPTPVRVGCFDENDVAVVLKTLPEISINGGAETELWNATNGFPVMLLEVLNSVCSSGISGAVSVDAMCSACESAYPALRDKLDALWVDCPASSRELQRRVVEEGVVPRSGIANVDADTLIERGFIQLTANKLQRPSRLVKRYLTESPNEGNALSRLFDSVDGYRQNFRNVLERRISQIDDIDPALKRYLIRGVEDLPEHPAVFLTNVHGILEQALSLIWKTECWSLDSGKPHIPSEWFSIWAENDERGFDHWRARFPEGGQRLRLLDLITGTQKVDRLASYVTKNTYVLANSVQGFRDFGVHPKAADVTLGTAFAALHACIELAAAITAELPKPAR